MSDQSGKIIERILNNLKAQEFYEGQIRHIEKIEKKPPQIGNLRIDLNKKIHDWLDFRDFCLYSHQTESIDSVLEGNNTIIVTSTASGKSLCYNVPVLQSILSEPDSTFLYIFPQKALSQDQYSKLQKIFDYLGLPQKLIGIYDGDTPKEEKARIRKESRIIITNPYGLHYYLPFRSLWARIWRNLKYIIVDECHQYRGIFGTNFAHVIRRLTRILKSFKNNPQFVLCSATINNSKELAEKLTGKEKFKVIDVDGSPNPGRFFVLWDLPMYGNSDQYKSPHTQTRNLFNYIVGNDLQTLAFSPSRKMAELNAYFSRNYFKSSGDELFSERIISYRAGINPEDRRKIEKALRNNDLIGVYATNALELGVDIGSLECTILSGFPGTISSMWQQVGRAGRKYDPNVGIESLSFLIPMANPLDLYYINNPEELLSKPHEICNINLDNHYILKNHLKCAAKEGPLTEKDTELFGSKYNETILNLEKENIIKKRGTRYFYNSKETFPPISVNLSGISNNDFKIVLKQGNNLAPIITYEEKGYVFKELHQGAIYLYMAEPYQVDEFDLESKTVYLSQSDGTIYTDSKIITDITQKGKPDKSKVENGINIYYGDVDVQETVIGYDIISIEKNKKLSYELLNLPPLDLDTKAVWFSIPPRYVEVIEEKGYHFGGSIHAIEHTAISISPYFCMCDRWDIGGVSTKDGGNELSGWPVIYIYDGFPGGIGITESLYEILPSLLEKTLNLIKTCKCKEQCPGCVMSPKCGNSNYPLDKYGAIELLKLLLNEEK
ncbi:MAG: DEAD/DEAH box helicase [archaeon]|nr:DEAD/DEAH box helicase [archaeon]